MVDQSPPAHHDAESPDAGPFRAKPTAARRSPQDDKRLSYDKDRRNAYGENDKGSRKAIPLHKRKVNSANRHHDHQILLGATGIRQDDAAEDAADDKLHGRRRKTWRKHPDETLRRVVTRQLKRRRHGYSPTD